jgi:DNA-binding transcriptional LysR family regulator
MERLEPRLAEYFLAVAEELHFTRAAARLHIAQPSLSAAIRQLEMQLGVTLLERTTRQVSLTAAGEALVPRARDMLASAAEAVAVTRAAADSLPVRVTIGVTRSAYPFGVTLIRALQKRVPTLQIEVRHDFAAPLEDRLLADELELAVIFCPTRRAALRYQRLADLPAVVSVHPSHRLAPQSALKIDELRHETLSLAPDWIGPGYNKASSGCAWLLGSSPRQPYRSATCLQGVSRPTRRSGSSPKPRSTAYRSHTRSTASRSRATHCQSTSSAAPASTPQSPAPHSRSRASFTTTTATKRRRLTPAPPPSPSRTSRSDNLRPAPARLQRWAVSGWSGGTADPTLPQRNSCFSSPTRTQHSPLAVAAWAPFEHVRASRDGGRSAVLDASRIRQAVVIDHYRLAQRNRASGRTVSQRNGGMRHHGGRRLEPSRVASVVRLATLAESDALPA